MSLMPAATCPECGTPYGPGTPTDAYKHGISCFHLPAQRPEDLTASLGRRDDEYARRVRAWADFVRAGGK